MSFRLFLFTLAVSRLSGEFAQYFPCPDNDDHVLQYLGPAPGVPWDCDTQTDAEIDNAFDESCSDLYGAGARNIRGTEVDQVEDRPGTPEHTWTPACDGAGAGCGGSCTNDGHRICRAYTCEDPWDLTPPYRPESSDSCYWYRDHEVGTAAECVRCYRVQPVCKIRLVAGIKRTVPLIVNNGADGIRVLSPGATCRFLPERGEELSGAGISGCQCDNTVCTPGDLFFVEITAAVDGPSGAHIYGGCGDVVDFLTGESFFLVDNAGAGVEATGPNLASCNWIDPSDGTVLLLNDCDYNGNLDPVGVRVTMSAFGQVTFNC